MKYFITFIIGLISHFCYAQEGSPYIVIDQFGYLPVSEKIAIIRNPRIGYDSAESFAPGAEYALIDEATGESVFSGGLTQWRGGATHDGSGDRVWYFDFSEITAAGDYHILDVQRDVRSHTFKIDIHVYQEVLKQAMRTFYYQRAGYAKEAPYAAEGWTDGASHIGPMQDTECRLFSSPSRASTERDLSGGWYDAGDYNKYTNWTANYVVELIKAYQENPHAWGDDYDLPESGNGIPDIIDEIRWGVDHLLRLQEADGSVLSIVGMDHASPPSAAAGRSLYGPASTSATQNTAAALAMASTLYAELDTDYAAELLDGAEAAYDWAVANPDVLFRNNDASYGSQGLGAGQQEENDYGRFVGRMEAACYLYEVTGQDRYKEYFESNYQRFHLFEWNFAYPFEAETQEVLLYFAELDGVTESVATAIKTTYLNAMINGSENFPAYESEKDAYRSHLKDYTWGSNGVKCSKANMYYDIITYDIDEERKELSRSIAEQYIHYLHGANPQGMVYLSNMYAYGGDHCVNEFYHTWFQNGSALWDRVGESTFGPAPGFLTGGPNPSYSRDGCCPSGCGAASNNAKCDSEDLSPPLDQPDQKSYKDFNTSWPLNSWSVTENSNGYQVRYLKLLSKYVDLRYDCHGDLGGEAARDVCGTCAGGNTGVAPETNPAACQSTSTDEPIIDGQGMLYPNPNDGTLYIRDIRDIQTLMIYDLSGNLVYESTETTENQYDISHLQEGLFIVKLHAEEKAYRMKMVKL